MIHDAAVQIRPDQPDHAGVIDVFPETVDQDVMIDPVKELRQVNVDYDSPARLDVRLRGQHRIMRTPARPEAVAVLAESGVKQWLQHLEQCLLDQSIRHRRDAQLALASVRFPDRYPSYRAGPLRPCQQTFANRRPFGLQQSGRLVNVQSVHPCRSLVGTHPLERLPQVLSCQRRRQQRRPCAPGFMTRAAGFVADGYARSFTACYSRPPRLRGHLTPCL